MRNLLVLLLQNLMQSYTILKGNKEVARNARLSFLFRTKLKVLPFFVNDDEMYAKAKRTLHFEYNYK